VATPEPVESSQRLARAASAELVRLQKTLVRSERKELTLRRQLAEVEAEAREIRQRINLVERLAGNRETLTGRPADERANVLAFRPHTEEPPNGFLRGAMIRTIAVRLLAATEMARRPIHYLDWLRLIESAGYGIKGQDPGAALLTQLGRSPVVFKADAPGTYILDHDAPRRLRERLEQLGSELSALHQGQQTIQAITDARERRAELVIEIGRTERAFDESIESLGLDPSATPHG
jgi:hypothetical protein